jgi:competence protein ComEC
MKKSTRNFIIGLLFILGLIIANHFGMLDNIDQNDESKIWFYNSQGFEFKNHQKYIYQGIIIAPPDTRIDHQKIKIKTTQLLDPLQKKIEGNVLIKTELYPPYKYGDQIEITSFLIKPEPIEDFKYDKYLAKDKIYSLAYGARVKLIKQGQANPILQIIYNLRQNISNQINKIWPEPTASFVNSILLGYKKAMSEDLKEEFRKAGVSHIIVISGLHITLITLLLSKTLYSLNIDRKKQLPIILIILSIFAILSGFSASTIRASVMGLIILFSQNIGRRIQKHLILIYAAVIILLINPLLLFYDLGFQLSFLATIGLIYLSPIFKKLFKFLPSKMEIQSTFISSFSAIIMTLPLTIYQFKTISILAPIANLFILPMIPILMLFGFITIIISYLSFTLAKLIGFIEYILSKVLFEIVNSISNIEFSSIDINNFDILAMILSYILIIIIFIYFNKTKNKN